MCPLVLLCGHLKPRVCMIPRVSSREETEISKVRKQDIFDGLQLCTFFRRIIVPSFDPCPQLWTALLFLYPSANHPLSSSRRCSRPDVPFPASDIATAD